MVTMKKLMKSIGTWLRALVSKTFEAAEDLAEPAVLLTNEIKFFVEKNGEQLERLVALTDTKKDDKFLALVRSKLPEVAENVIRVRGILDNGDDDETILLKFAELIKGTKIDDRGIFYAEIASTLLSVAFKAVTGKPLPGWVSFLLTQLAFGRLSKKG